MVKKDNSLPPVRVTDKMKAETVKCADAEQENLAEYCRKSVGMRNKEVLKEIISLKEGQELKEGL